MEGMSLRDRQTSLSLGRDGDSTAIRPDVFLSEVETSARRFGRLRKCPVPSTKQVPHAEALGDGIRTCILQSTNRTKSGRSRVDACLYAVKLVRIKDPPVSPSITQTMSTHATLTVPTVGELSIPTGLFM